MNPPMSHPQTLLQALSPIASLTTAWPDPWVPDDEDVRKGETYIITLIAMTTTMTTSTMGIVLHKTPLRDPKPSHVNEAPTPTKKCRRSGNGD